MAIVYQHRRKDTNEVFYIGIGKTRRRAYSKENRNNHWHNIVNKVGYDVDILMEGLTWDDACIKETELIKNYGRNDLGEGFLVNMTDGGEGTPNRILSDESKRKIGEASKGRQFDEEARKKMSDYHKGNKNALGHKHDEATRKKMSQSRTGKPRSEEFKRMMSEKYKGQKMSEEQKKKLSQATMGRVPWNKGLKYSDEIKKNIVKANKKRYNNNQKPGTGLSEQN